MIDANNREPVTAIATLGFFGIGQIFSYLGDPDTLRHINTFLSTISFLVSISVGAVTLIKTYKRWKKQ
jgi:hypothetical protein